MSELSRREAEELIEVQGQEAEELFFRAHRVRLAHRGRGVAFCSIINAKSGHCPQDCAFCAQSSHNDAPIERYPLVSVETILEGARRAVEHGAARYSIVTSGAGALEDPERRRLVQAIEAMVRELPVKPCASLGMLSRADLARLRDAGLRRYHHNLETAESFFSQICTTQSYGDSLATIEAARELGLSLCVGGLFGLGESPKQRVELLWTLKELGVESVPLNFLNPISGTRLESVERLAPRDCLKVAAVARLLMPQREIRVCGGREVNLRDIGSWLLLAGVDGLMVGGYLTTPGRGAEQDRQMVEDAGFHLRGGAGEKDHTGSRKGH